MALTQPNGWYVWDRETNNACGWFATEEEALAAWRGWVAVNPDFADAFVVFEDPT